MMISTTHVVRSFQEELRAQLPGESIVSHEKKSQAAPRKLPRMAPLDYVVSSWSNLTLAEVEMMWKLYVLDNSDAVGYIPDRFAREATWDRSLFRIDPKARVICLDPIDQSLGSLCACNMAMVTFCEQNRNVDGFRAGLRSWLRKNEQFKMGLAAMPDYHPILTRKPGLEDLKLPSPVRGILGVATAGIHLNVYTVKNKMVDKIWVSRRGPNKVAYPDCYDQIVAGGMDPEDRRNPWVTLCHEMIEESRYMVEGRNVYRQGCILGGIQYRGPWVGEIESTMRIIYFRTQKDELAGDAENGHVELGLRFCFDLRLTQDELPEANEPGIKFSALSVDEVKHTLTSLRWKPNSGLVTLDFLLRKGLVEDKTDREAIEGLSEESLALELPEFEYILQGPGSCEARG